MPSIHKLPVITTIIFFSLLIAYRAAFAIDPPSDKKNEKEFTLTLQTRNQENKIEIRNDRFKNGETAILVMDMWDNHWCKSFARKAESMIDGMNKTIRAARELGVQVIFVPSETMDFYKNDARHLKVKGLPNHPLNTVKEFNPPPYPSSDAVGCECGKEASCVPVKSWTRQHKDLAIESNDVITDDVQEINNFCRENGIRNLIYIGVASNAGMTQKRPSSAISMTRYGYTCIVVRDMVASVSDNGYDPDLINEGQDRTPETVSPKYIEHTEKYIAPSISANQLLIWADIPGTVRKHELLPAMFSAREVRDHRPRGATASFRQLCYDYNWVGRTLSDIPEKFTESSAADYAELSKKINLDGVLVLAVPHHGYTTYNSAFTERFPALKEDWFGNVVKELHKRKINALGYITLGTNWKFMREHIGRPYIHTNIDEQGTVDRNNGLCFNAPGYLSLVENYSREILSHYPVDALRYDMFFSPENCECGGCRSLYKKLYNEDFTSWADISEKDSNRISYFNLATLNQTSSRIINACREVKPSVEIWQNHINTYSEADINLGRKYDVAYIEYGDPFRLLALRGILDKNAIIVGQTLTSPIRRQIMALGARCYQYVKVNQKTALPDDRSWFIDDLAPFFKMVSEIQPYLEEATLPSNIGVVFSENTRYHFPGFDRSAYMRACEGITLNYLNSSLPLQFINALDLEKKELEKYTLLLLPRTSGLSAKELERLKDYVRKGGSLMVMGDALLYDASGKRSPSFSLSSEMGLDFKQFLPVKDTIQVKPEDLILSRKIKKRINNTDLHPIKIADLVEVRATAGTTLLSMRYNQTEIPLVHVNKYGKGQIIYIATADAEKLSRSVADHFTGPLPVTVSEKDKQVIFARQEEQRRWVLHLIDDGDYEVTIDKRFAPVAEIASQYPASGWKYKVIREDNRSLTISVEGNTKDKLLVLQ